MEKYIDEKLHTLRHSCSHIMAQAVQKLYPQAKLAIGPAIENGFYYDFDTEHRFSEEDFEKIEKEMRDLIKRYILHNSCNHCKNYSKSRI